MALEKVEYDAGHCQRCSTCKWSHLWEIKSHRFSRNCPSVWYGKYDAYAAQGKNDITTGLLAGELNWEEDKDKLLEIIYRCPVCAACDINCKRIMDLDIIGVLDALREEACEKGAGPLPATPAASAAKQAIAGRIWEGTVTAAEAAELHVGVGQRAGHRPDPGPPLHREGLAGAGGDAEPATDAPFRVVHHAVALEAERVHRTAPEAGTTAGAPVGIVPDPERRVRGARGGRRPDRRSPPPVAPIVRPGRRVRGVFGLGSCDPFRLRGSSRPGGAGVSRPPEARSKNSESCAAGRPASGRASR